MSTAVITFTYNEAVNLPLWVRYYGSNFGTKNLFVGDRGSTDGSVNDLGDVNVLKLPRKTFDEYEKTSFITNMHRSLLNFYDTVIITDCDELLLPDPTHYNSLRHFIDANDFDYVNCIGMDVLHVITKDPPLDVDQPILSQRSWARFSSPLCKNLISRVPIEWLPGFHSCDKPPHFVPGLYMMHTKLMDYSFAMQRQRINQETIWSEKSRSLGHGAHHQFSFERFVHESFLVPLDMMSRGISDAFNFDEEIAQFQEKTVAHDGKFYIPMDMSRIVKLPDRFAGAL